MTDELEKRRAIDFLIGFLLTTLVAGVSTILVIQTGSMQIAMWAVAALIGVAMIMVLLERPFIAIGIFVIIAAIPVLLVGSCFYTLSGVF